MQLESYSELVYPRELEGYSSYQQLLTTEYLAFEAAEEVSYVSELQWRVGVVQSGLMVDMTANE